ncbi:MAG: hypothetical protein C4532_06865, partial [Candidatus Abyssobacteria bacterium SURF_17]
MLLFGVLHPPAIRLLPLRSLRLDGEKTVFHSDGQNLKSKTETWKPIIGSFSGLRRGRFQPDVKAVEIPLGQVGDVEMKLLWRVRTVVGYFGILFKRCPEQFVVIIAV